MVSTRGFTVDSREKRASTYRVNRLFVRTGIDQVPNDLSVSGLRTEHENVASSVVIIWIESALLDICPQPEQSFHHLQVALVRGSHQRSHEKLLNQLQSDQSIKHGCKSWVISDIERTLSNNSSCVLSSSTALITACTSPLSAAQWICCKERNQQISHREHNKQQRNSQGTAMNPALTPPVEDSNGRSILSKLWQHRPNADPE